MKGLVSFHPVDLAFFDELVSPLVAGGKINPERFLQDALRVRRTWHRARRYPRALATLKAAAVPPPVDPAANLWSRMRANLEKVDFRPEPLAKKAAERFEADLHLEGRPFFIAEGSAEKVAAAVEAYAAADGEPAADRIAEEQLSKLDPAFAGAVVPEEGDDLSADLQHRNDLLSEMKDLFDLARKEDAAEIPWRALRLHARVVPFWVGRDVDGLETICRAAGVPAPDCLVPAWRPFAEACERFPALREALHLEIRAERDVGAFVAPADVPALLEFLGLNGARILAAATRAGEGALATTLLRKIKECAVYAERRGTGYLEASGVVPPDLDA